MITRCTRHERPPYRHTWIEDVRIWEFTRPKAMADFLRACCVRPGRQPACSARHCVPRVRTSFMFTHMHTHKGMICSFWFCARTRFCACEDESPTREYFVFTLAHMNTRRAHKSGFTPAVHIWRDDLLILVLCKYFCFCACVDKYLTCTFIWFFTCTYEYTTRKFFVCVHTHTHTHTYAWRYLM